MLHQAHDVRVARVLVLPIKESLSECLVVAHHVALVNADLDVVPQVGGQVWQGCERLVQEPLHGVFRCRAIQLFLELQELLCFKDLLGSGPSLRLLWSCGLGLSFLFLLLNFSVGDLSTTAQTFLVVLVR